VAHFKVPGPDRHLSTDTENSVKTTRGPTIMIAMM
jgi:hypothetical protein